MCALTYQKRIDIWDIHGMVHKPIIVVTENLYESENEHNVSFEIHLFFILVKISRFT